MRTYKPHARVAGRTSQRIDGVDGVLTTHTQRGWVHGWTVADGPDAAAPFPVGAKGISAVVAVSAMCAVVLTATFASLVVVTAGHPDQFRVVLACLGALAGLCLLVATPALIRAAVRLPRDGTNR